MAGFAAGCESLHKQVPPLVGQPERLSAAKLLADRYIT